MKKAVRPAASPARPRRRRRLLLASLWTLAILLAIVLVLGIVIPPILSSDWARGKMETALADGFGRPVRLGDVEFGWISGMVVTDFQIGESDLAARRLKIAPRLASLLSDRPDFRHVELVGVRLLVRRNADGSFTVPAIESLRRPPAAPAGPSAPGQPVPPASERPALAGLTATLAAEDFVVVLEDEREGELLEFGPVSAEARLRPDRPLTPISVWSEAEGFRIDGSADLFRTRPAGEPAAQTVVVLDGIDAARYARLAEVVAGLTGLAGRLHGRIEARLTTRESGWAAADLRIAGPAAAGRALAGEVRITGRATLAEGRVELPDGRFTAPGVKVEFAGSRGADGRISGAAHISADAAPLRAALSGVPIPESFGRAELALTADTADLGATVRVDGEIAAPPGALLLPAVPELGATATLSGAAAFDKALSFVRMAEPLALAAGGATATISGEILRPRADDREGILTLDLGGRLAGPARSADLRGELTLEADGGRIVLGGEIVVANLVVESETGPPIRERRLVLRPVASFHLSARELTVNRVEATGEGLLAEFTGPIAGLPSAPRGEGRLVVSGDLGRVRAFLPPDSALDPAGTASADFSFVADGRSVAATGRATLSRAALSPERPLGDATVNLSARVFPADHRAEIESARATLGGLAAEVAGQASWTDGLAFSGGAEIEGSLAGLPPAIRPADLRTAGTIAGTAAIEFPGRLTLALTGENIVADGLPGPAPRIETERLALSAAADWAKGARAPVVASSRLETPAGVATLTGPLDPAGAARATISLVSDVGAFARTAPGLFPDGFAAEGRAEAELRLEGDLAAALAEEARAGGGPLALLSGAAEVALARASWSGYTVEAGTFEAVVRERSIRLTKGDFRLNGGPAKATGGVDLTGETPRFDVALDTSGVRLVQRMEPEARYLVPIFGAATELSGILGLSGSVRTAGDPAEGFFQSLTGSLSVRVDDGAVRGSPILSAILEWLGEPKTFSFDDVGGTLRFREGRIATDDLLVTAGDVVLRFRGWTGVDGDLDYEIGVKPGAGTRAAKQLASVLGRDGFVPIRLTGRFDRPQLALPKIERLAEDALRDLLKEGLNDLLRPR